LCFVFVVLHTSLYIYFYPISNFLNIANESYIRELTRNLDSSIFGVCKKSSMCNTRNTVLNRGLILCLHTCTLRFFTFLPPSFTRQVWYQNMQVKDEQGGGLKYTFLSL